MKRAETDTNYEVAQKKWKGDNGYIDLNLSDNDEDCCENGEQGDKNGVEEKKEGYDIEETKTGEVQGEHKDYGKVTNNENIKEKILEDASEYTGTKDKEDNRELDEDKLDLNEEVVENTNRLEQIMQFKEEEGGRKFNDRAMKRRSAQGLRSFLAEQSFQAELTEDSDTEQEKEEEKEEEKNYPIEVQSLRLHVPFSRFLSYHQYRGKIQSDRSLHNPNLESEIAQSLMEQTIVRLEVKPSQNDYIKLIDRSGVFHGLKKEIRLYHERYKWDRASEQILVDFASAGFRFNSLVEIKAVETFKSRQVELMLATLEPRMFLNLTNNHENDYWVEKTENFYSEDECDHNDCYVDNTKYRLHSKVIMMTEPEKPRTIIMDGRPIKTEKWHTLSVQLLKKGREERGDEDEEEKLEGKENVVLIPVDTREFVE